MYFRPLSTLTIPAGDAGTLATVAALRRWAQAAALDPLVRSVAAELVRGRPLAEHPGVLADWIGSVTEFLPDPAVAETVFAPRWILQRILTAGVAQIDCDDVATLAAAMGLSIGLGARFVVVGFGSPNAPYRHIWAELTAFDGSSGWVPVDPTRPAQGFTLPVSRSFSVEV